MERRIITYLDVIDRGEASLSNHADKAAAAAKEHENLAIKIKAYESAARNAKTEAEKLDFAKSARTARIEYEKLTGTLLRETGIVEGLRAEVKLLEQAFEHAADASQMDIIAPRLNLARQRLADITQQAQPQPATSQPSATQAGLIGGVVGGVVVKGLEMGMETLRAFGDTVISSTVEYEKFEAALETSYQSTIQASEALTMLTEIASLTPSSLAEMTQAFIKLKGTGFEPTKESLISISDLAASMGESTIRYTESIVAAMNGENDMLKAFNITAQRGAKTTQFTFNNITTEVSNSKEAIRDYLIGLGKLPGIAGASEAASKTLGGAISNLGDNLFKAGVAAGKSTGIIKDTVLAVSDLVGWFGELISSSPSEQLEKERQGFESLTYQVLAAGEGTASRNQLIAQMRSQYPDYLKFLSLETLSNEDLAKTLDIVNSLYEQRVSQMLFGENEKAALKNYNEQLKDTSNEFRSLLDFFRNSAASKGIAFNPIDIVGAEGDAKKLMEIVDRIFPQTEVVYSDEETYRSKAKKRVDLYIQSYQQTLNAQNEYQSKSNESAQAKNKTEILQLEKLNEAIQISIDSNNKKLQANANDAAAKGALEAELKQKHLNDLKLRLLKEANTLEMSERKKIQDEIDKLEGKSSGAAPSSASVEAIKKEAKAKKDAYEKANKDLSKEIEQQRADIEKLQLPKGENIAAITAAINNQKEAELKAIGEKYKSLVDDLKQKGVGAAQIEALKSQKTEIEKLIGEKFAIKLKFDVDKFNEAKQKAIDDLAAKDFEFKVNIRINEIRGNEKSSLADLMQANAMQAELAAEKLKREFSAKEKELIDVLGKDTPELAAAVESLNTEYDKLLDAETVRKADNNAKDALKVLQKMFDSLNKESQSELMKIDINELNAITTLNKAYSDGLMSKTEYERAKTEVQKEYASLRLSESEREIDAEIALLDKMILDAKNKGLDTKALEEQRKPLEKRRAENVNAASAPDVEASQFEQRTAKAEEYFDAIKTGYEGIREIAETYRSEILQKEIEAYDKRIEIQKANVDGTLELLKNGNEAAYNDEQKTLKRLELEREKQVEKERKLSTAIQIANAAMSASYAALAIAKALVLDPTGITTAPRIAAIIAAGAGGIAAIIGLFAAVRNATSAKEGKYMVGVGEKPIGKDSTGTNEYPYILHEGEMVLTKKEADKVRALGGVSDLPQIATRTITENKKLNEVLIVSGGGGTPRNETVELKKQTSILSEQVSEMKRSTDILYAGFKELIKKQKSPSYR